MSAIAARASDFCSDVCQCKFADLGDRAGQERNLSKTPNHAKVPACGGWTVSAGSKAGAAS
jgi:hypothetical protein